MASPAVFAAVALVAGAACGAGLAPLPPQLLLGLSILTVAAIVGWWLCWTRATTTAAAVAFATAGLILAAHEADRALHTSIRAALDDRFGGFVQETLGPAGQHEPLPTRAVLIEDGAQIGDVATVRTRVVAVRLEHTWIDVDGGVTLTIAGTRSGERVETWLAGRMIEAPVTFRRPARYLNEGVSDFERDLALDGTTLFGTVKSAFLVHVLARGNTLEEACAAARLLVRHHVGRWITPYAPSSAAIVTAVLIGDRTGLPDEIRARLQAAGTYHVIAISGGNIAILAAAIAIALMAIGVGGRRAAFITLVVILAYAQIVTSGASVWRATIMATLYLTARLLDHRSPALHALIVTAAIVACAHPLDVRDPAFALTFGATVALLAAGSRVAAVRWRYSLLKWLAGSLAASAAVEIILLPVNVQFFSRITIAGLVLNLLAVPLMVIVQLAGMIIVGADRVTFVAAPAAWFAHEAVTMLVTSAGVVDEAPWLTRRVPPPSLTLVIAYYLGLAIAVRGGRAGHLGLVAVVALGVAISLGVASAIPSRRPTALRLTIFDIGQGDSALLELSQDHTVMIDTGGIPFGNGFDIGGRVLAPALWARGIRSLEVLLLTHGDPDHIGGASAVIRDFAPRHVWQGIPVERHLPLQEVLARGRESGAGVEQRKTGEQFDIGTARVRVLNPPSPDWERQKVRNDDSVVLEVLYGDVAVLMTGDIEADVEQQVLPQLTPARVRILKVAHHGSRTSSSRAFLEAWRPQIAIISCGRGNRFGHPAPDVVARLREIGATIYRTDRDGQVTVDTDGHSVQVRTYVGERKTPPQR